MSPPWLSVIVPTFDGARYLAHALESIARQRDESLEVLVVDDGSRDDTLRIVKNYQSKLRIDVHALTHHGNWVANVNHGMRHARGTYLSILHQDDAWCSDRLRRLKPLVAQHPSAALFVHPCWYINAAGRRIGSWRCPFARGAVVIPAPAALKALIVHCAYGVPAPMFRAALAREVGLMDESLWFAADWDFWLKMTHLGHTIHCPTPLAMFRLHAASQTIARARRPDEIRLQQTLVQNRHLARVGDLRATVELSHVARFSIEANNALMGWLGGRPMGFWGLAKHFVALGPSGWGRYFRDSRIVERCMARIRAGAVGWRAAAQRVAPLVAAPFDARRPGMAEVPFEARSPIDAPRGGISSLLSTQ